MNHAEETLQWLLDACSDASDLVLNVIRTKSMEGHMLYIHSICDEQKIQRMVLNPFYQAEDFAAYIHYLHSLPSTKIHSGNEETLGLIMRGNILIAFDSHLYLIDVVSIKNDQVGPTNVETTLLGPKMAFSEDVSVNIGLIRNRYPQPTLHIEETTAGELSKTTLVLLYDEKFVDRHALQRIRQAIADVDVNVLQAGSQLQTKINGVKWSIFPTSLVTERPDRVVYNLPLGKIIVLLQGTPFALIAPSVLFDFMSSMDDVYESYGIRRFLILLRYIGLGFSMTLASFYVAVTSYNPEILRVQLALSIAGSRAPVPYPSYIEVTFMLLMMELLTEASVRLPKTVGTTAATVGGLILGQAATQAGLVSNIMIIIVAAVAISNFVVPVISMGFGMRISKYFILVLSSMFGLMGMLVGIVGLIVYLAQLDSFGTPYLKISWGRRT